MSAGQTLPDPKDRQAREQILQAMERWKKYLFPNLPGEPVSLEEFNHLSVKLIAWRDRHASHIDIQPIETLRQICLQLGRQAAGLQVDWEPSASDLQATAQLAVGVCQRLEHWLRRLGEESSQRDDDPSPLAGAAAFADFSVKQRRLLTALSGKQFLAIAEVKKAVYGTTDVATSALERLVARANHRLAESSYRLEIKRKANTLRLQPF